MIKILKNKEDKVDKIEIREYWGRPENGPTNITFMDGRVILFTADRPYSHFNTVTSTVTRSRR